MAQYVVTFYFSLTFYRVILVDPLFVRRMRFITSMVWWAGVTTVARRTSQVSMLVSPHSLTGSMKRCVQL